MSPLAPANRLGLGLAAIGRPSYITLGHREDLGGAHPDPATLERHAHAVLDEAFAVGIRYLDAARSYGRAEAFLASWLASRRAEEATVASKWGYTYVADWDPDAERHEIKDHSLDAFRRQWAETEALLGNHLRLYQIHSATPDTGVLADAAVLDALAEQRDRGVAIGVTTSGPHQADTVAVALEVQRGGEPLFAAVQSTWNVLEPSVGDALAAAHDAGRTVIVKEVLANGRLAGHDADLAAALQAAAPTLATPDAIAMAAAPQAASRAPAATGDEPSTEVASAPGSDDAPVDSNGAGLPPSPAAATPTPDAVAMAAALAQPWADVVLSGAATPAQVRSNVVALGLRVDLDALAGLAERPDRYWATRAELPWQ